MQIFQLSPKKECLLAEVYQVYQTDMCIMTVQLENVGSNKQGCVSGTRTREQAVKYCFVSAIYPKRFQNIFICPQNNKDS